MSISNASGKNEVAIEFTAPERKEGNHRIRGDMLAEIRFYVQNNEIQNRDENSDKEEDGEEEVTPAKCFNDKLITAAGLGDQ